MLDRNDARNVRVAELNRAVLGDAAVVYEGRSVAHLYIKIQGKRCAEGSMKAYQGEESLQAKNVVASSVSMTSRKLER